MRRPSAAVVLTCVALFIALSGIAMGATHHHFRITSKKQISPKALRQLRAATRGKPGRPGPAGPAGPAGSAGGSGGGGAVNLTYFNTSVNLDVGNTTGNVSLDCPSGGFPVDANSQRGTLDTLLNMGIAPKGGFSLMVLDDGGLPGQEFLYYVCASGPGLTTVNKESVGP